MNTNLDENTEALEASEENTAEEVNPDMKWYVAHTYSGYENKVKQTILKTVENMKLQDQIKDVMVPVQKVTETRDDGSTREVERKLYPGYVFVNMINNEDTWYIVRNTTGVTGFVGPGSVPVPLTEEEMEHIGLQTQTPVKEEINVHEGDRIHVKEGIWAGEDSVVKSVDQSKKKILVTLNNIDAWIDIADIMKL